MSSLDHAIDVVARKMTALDAPAGMRADVLAQIEGSPRAWTSLFPRWALASGMAVLVLAVATAVWFARPGDRPESINATNNSSLTPATGTAQPQPSTQLASAGPAASSTADARPAAGAERVANGVAAAQPDQNGSAASEIGPAALATPAPLAIAAIGPDAIHIADIGIEPLADLRPITIQDIPVGSGESQSPPIQKIGDEPNTSGIRRIER